MTIERVEEKPNDCCRDETNLSLVWASSKGISHYRCDVCGANHYSVTLEPLELGVEGKSL